MKKTTRIGTFLLTLALFVGLLPVMSAPASALTLKEKQDAIVAATWAYYDKGLPVQYDSINLSVVKRIAAPIRSTYYVSPEDASPDETIFSVCSGFCSLVFYNVLGYKLKQNPVTATTGYLAKWTPETDPICVWRYDSHAETDKSPEKRMAVLKEFLSKLQPGDMINGTNKINGGGHAMMYVGDSLGDGTKYILHCAGYKYNIQTGEDRPEGHTGDFKAIPGQINPLMTDKRYGGITIDPVEEYIINKYKDPKRDLILSIIRPLAVVKDEENPVSEAALDRVKYPRLTINRTATGMRFRDVEEGSTVTLKVELINKSKQAYTVPVKETAPAKGVTFVKASDGAKVDGSNISWDVTLNAGETKVVSYDVTVTAKRGETITFADGWVGKIPSNTINIPVGGKHLTEADEALLKDVAAAKYKDLYRGMDKNLLPELIWQKVLKLNVALPTPKEIVDDLTEEITFEGKQLRALRDDLTGLQKDWRNMIVPELYGGLLHDEMDSRKRVLDLRCDYLRPGDIVYEIKSVEKPSDGQTLIYLGNEKFLRQTRTTGGAAVATFFEWQKAHTFQLFYVLRPSLAYDDVHNLPKLANPVDNKIFKFTDVQPSDWFYNNVRELAADGIIKGMTETTFAPNGTLTYGQALKLIGMAVGEKEPAKSGAHWASGWLTLAKSKGWLASDVNLDSNITRLALCQIAAKAKGLTEQPSTNPFKDTADKDVLALNKAKVIDGMTKTEFKPNELLTRAQISKIIYALREIVTEIHVEVEDSTAFD
ncbi:MAG: S-layer homology domain-containing protein [Oscillospiraceae bacterium]|nr:S-layer homology domain-containing protein [Oscillospiraceae bacterium]